MLFNSFEFFVFLPVVFLLYWFVFKKSLRNQNLFILIASYFFYACWDYRFLLLLIFSTVLDYYSGIKINATQNLRKRKFWYVISIFINLGFLGFFKYFNFFSDSFEELFNIFGFKADFITLNVVLPIGISFYTFHGVSYIIDIYKGRIKPEKKLIDYSVFVCFFPLLVAGPIERAKHLLPQISSKRRFNYSNSVDGMRQILWGLFKKVVIADGCAVYVNDIFSNYDTLGGSTLLLGAILFSIQIYGDFSGYTDIALGVARMLGFELMRNFNYPYLSKSVTEFWRRWHISLSTWFNDYIFTPMIIKWRDLGNNGIYLSLFLTFFLSGLWHGAGWTFIVYGSMHGLLLIIELKTKKNRKKLLSKLPIRFVTISSQLFTFLFVTFAFVFFRSKTINDAFLFISSIFSKSFFSFPQIGSKSSFLFLVVIIVAFFLIERFQQTKKHGLAIESYQIPLVIRRSIYILIVFIIILMGGKQETFIYFQF